MSSTACPGSRHALRISRRRCGTRSSTTSLTPTARAPTAPRLPTGCGRDEQPVAALMAAADVFLIRHGETEWSLNGRHTGVSDIPLTEKGREVARLWQPYAAARTFALVLSSPLQRARQTCELAGLGAQMHLENDLSEWDYGDYEG